MQRICYPKTANASNNKLRGKVSEFMRFFDKVKLPFCKKETRKAFEESEKAQEEANKMAEIEHYFGAGTILLETALKFKSKWSGVKPPKIILKKQKDLLNKAILFFEKEIELAERMDSKVFMKLAQCYGAMGDRLNTESLIKLASKSKPIYSYFNRVQTLVSKYEREILSLLFNSKFEAAKSKAREYAEKLSEIDDRFMKENLKWLNKRISFLSIFGFNLRTKIKG